MNSKVVSEDGAFILYLLPIVVSIIYGAIEWAQISSSSRSMPIAAYLIVSKDPFLFLGSLAAVCLALVIETRSASSGEKQGLVSANSTRMQALAIIVLIISFAAAISVSGYSDLGGAFGNFLRGTYALIFAFFLLVLSVLVSPGRLVGRAKLGVALPELIGLVFLGLSPLVLYGATKLHLKILEAGVVAIIVFIIGLFLVFGGMRVFSSKKQSAPPKAETAPMKNAT